MLGTENRSQASPVPPPALLEMMAGYWLSQAIYVAAKLGIADLLTEGPKRSGELAQAAGADPRSVHRLMRALASAGIFRAREDSCFEMTALAAQLQTGVSGSMRAMLIALGEEHYRAWGELLYSVKTGEAAWDHVYQMGIFEYFARHPGAGRKFAEAMTDLTAQISRAVTLAYDFSAIATLTHELENVRRLSRGSDEPVSKPIDLEQVAEEAVDAPRLLPDLPDHVRRCLPAELVPFLAQRHGEVEDRRQRSA